ncbi:uncharacterized protein LOC133318226 [Gastrolobium bilobum]|uniref:uncharacterized protein LOC133318226 n=1 Tax=Gastrolobium bilobum TaxID=150636 RepID=UPI002AAF7562|nr:uncharacterized protein LOC133318226 [Gastrolobium bilobum]
MASASVTAFLAFLFLHTLSATSDFLSPMLSPIYENVCKEVECGKGICNPSKNSTFFFECDCNPGWKQPLSAHDEGLKFLPCIIPNCTLNSSCSQAHAPVQQKTRKANESVFDACHWVDCGGGSCNMTSLFSYSCKCDAGYYNLLNATALPCFRECALGLDCSNLGISMTNSSTAAPPTSDENASLILRGSSLWLLMQIIFVASIQLQEDIGAWF